MENINYYRRKIWPTDPTDLDFNLDMDHIPSEFLQADISWCQNTHFILYNNNETAVT